MVLVRNAPVGGAPILPLDAATLSRVAVLGPLADVANTGDAGSSDVRPPSVVTPLAGLRDALDADVVHDDGSDPTRAAAVAAAADVAIVVVGYTAADEGEFIDPSANPELYAFFPPLDPDDPVAAELSTASRGAEPGPRRRPGRTDPPRRRRGAAPRRRRGPAAHDRGGRDRQRRRDRALARRRCRPS